MKLGELILALGCPPEVLVQQLAMAKVRQMEAAEAEVIEQAMVSGAMPGEFRVFLKMDRSNRFNTRFYAVLG